jgi:hypothetical protein
MNYEIKMTLISVLSRKCVLNIKIIFFHLQMASSKKAADIQVNVAGIRRTVKNLAHNYSDAQVGTKFMLFRSKIMLFAFYLTYFIVIFVGQSS